MAMQDLGGAGQHGADLVFSTTTRGLSGSLQDWLTITSSGLPHPDATHCHVVTSH